MIFNTNILLPTNTEEVIKMSKHDLDFEKITNKTPIKATAETAEKAMENNSPLLANALLHEVEDLIHEEEKE